MSVLEQMRSGTDSTFMQVVMALVVVSFVGWYAMPEGDKSSVVATVNGVKIMDTEYGRQYRQVLRQEEARYGRAMSNEEQRELGERVKLGLIEDKVILQEARRLGLEVSDTDVARQLLQIEMLRNEQGKFDQELYTRFLKRQQFTRADFEERLRENLLREKLRMLVFMGASISEPALRDAFVESETRIDLTYVRIRPSAFAEQVEITADERAAWLAENEQLVAETYERDLHRLYNHPERVRLRMIRLAATEDEISDTLPRLNKLKAEAEAGGDFAELARQWSEDPSAADGGDLGLRAIRQLSSDVQKAVESLQPGQISRVVTTDADLRLYLLEERVEPTVESLDDVRDQIADQLIKAERGPALAAAFAEDELLPRWRESGEVPQELVETRGLGVMTTGPIPAVSDGSLLSPPPQMMSAARLAEPGAVLPDVFQANGVLWVGQLTERIDADMSQYEAQRDQIREGVLQQRRIAFYQGWVDDTKARAKIQ